MFKVSVCKNILKTIPSIDDRLHNKTLQAELNSTKGNTTILLNIEPTFEKRTERLAWSSTSLLCYHCLTVPFYRTTVCCVNWKANTLNVLPTFRVVRRTQVRGCKHRVERSLERITRDSQESVACSRRWELATYKPCNGNYGCCRLNVMHCRCCCKDTYFCYYIVLSARMWGACCWGERVLLWNFLFIWASCCCVTL